MEIAVDDAGCELRDFSHIGAKRLPARLLGSQLRDGDNRAENGCGRQARKEENARVKPPV